MAGDGPGEEEDEKNKVVRALDADDIALLKSYGLGPYSTAIKAAEKASASEQRERRARESGRERASFAAAAADGAGEGERGEDRPPPPSPFASLPPRAKGRAGSTKSLPSCPSSLAPPAPRLAARVYTCAGCEGHREEGERPAGHQGERHRAGAAVAVGPGVGQADDAGGAAAAGAHTPAAFGRESESFWGGPLAWLRALLRLVPRSSAA